ncbi:MAG: hypothetical protein JO026_01030, partial [Patescibacteria group bacterium]|nr:hypothetical protein [Patescibacteria group bacterium]
MHNYNLTDIIYTATNLIVLFLPWGAIILWFTWTIADIIWKSGNAEKRKDSPDRLLWAVIAIFVLFSLGAIVGLINNSLFGPSAAIKAHLSTVSTGSNGQVGTQNGQTAQEIGSGGFTYGGTNAVGQSDQELGSAGTSGGKTNTLGQSDQEVGYGGGTGGSTNTLGKSDQELGSAGTSGGKTNTLGQSAQELGSAGTSGGKTNALGQSDQEIGSAGFKGGETGGLGQSD